VLIYPPRGPNRELRLWRSRPGNVRSPRFQQAASQERSLHILADLDEADRTAITLQATPRRRLRVHCYPVLARFVAPIVTLYRRDYLEVSVDLRRGD
jgi:hypothetical protein